MKRILAASLLTGLALAGGAHAGERCDLDGLSGPEVLARYPIPHPDQVPQEHTHGHVPWGFAAGPTAVQGAALGWYEPRIVGVGDFIPGGPCDLLWEERVADPDAPEPIIRVAITEGFTQADASHFAWGKPRPEPPWDVAGVFDLTADGRADVLWWNPQTGTALLWVRTANGWTEADVDGTLPPSLNIEPVGPVTAIVRFEPDAPPGIVWQPSLDDRLYQYFRTAWNGVALSIQAAGLVQGLQAPGYTLAAVGDFNGDGTDDLLQQNINTSYLRVCYMDGLVLASCVRLTPQTFVLSGYPQWFVAGPR